VQEDLRALALELLTSPSPNSETRWSRKLSTGLITSHDPAPTFAFHAQRFAYGASGSGARAQSQSEAMGSRAFAYGAMGSRARAQDVGFGRCSVWEVKGLGGEGFELEGSGFGA
jgi:hypothetical protein